ncbi:MAG TPA: flagellar basal body-associated FliL family protein [Thermodesulfobacteriota bacterium]|nr:flagellar basal body-associated FliL family protein [Thermodesulfobacteriota bacterium]
MAEERENRAPKKAEEDPSVPKEKKRGKKLFLFLGVFLFLLAGAGSILFFAPGLLPKGLQPGAEKKPDGEKREGISKKEQVSIYNMEAFIVNLADQDSQRYLKIKIDLQRGDSKADEEFEKRIPKLRDAILSILSARTYKEICDSAGKTNLKGEIKQKGNQVWSGFKIEAVYFTEFVIQ